MVKRAKASRRHAAYKRFAAGKTLELAGFTPDNSDQIKGPPAGPKVPLGKKIKVVNHRIEDLERRADTA